MKKILLTGANGLVGSKLCNKLATGDSEVYAAVKSFPDKPIKNVKYIVLDLCKKLNTDDLPRDIDYLVHLAQSNKFKEFPEGANDVFSVNVSSTHQLLEYARKSNVKHFIYASSGGIYSQSKSKLNENSSIQKNNELGNYLGSKICGEILVQNYSPFFKTSIIRPFFIYGFGQKRNMLLPRVYDFVENEIPIDLCGEEGLKINPIHVEDIVFSIKNLLESGRSPIYNLAGPKILSLRQICDSIGNYIGKDPIYKITSGTEINFISDISLMKSELHSPRISLLDRIDDLR